LDPWGRYLATGTQKGDVLFFDTTSFELVHTLYSPTNNAMNFTKSSEGEMEIPAETSNTGWNDITSTCMNTVQFHPYCGLLMGIKGERVFAPCLDDDDDDDDGEVGEESKGNKRKLVSNTFNRELSSSDVYLWSLDKAQLQYPDHLIDSTL